MIPVAVPFAVLTPLVLSALAVGFFAVFQLGTSTRKASAARQRNDTQVDSLQAQVNELTAEIQRLKHHPGPATYSYNGAVTRPLNLSKRAQALKMHKHGESPQQIACVLEISPQEVDLLVKVHQIVIRNI